MVFIKRQLNLNGIANENLFKQMRQLPTIYNENKQTNKPRKNIKFHMNIKFK